MSISGGGSSSSKHYCNELNPFSNGDHWIHFIATIVAVRKKSLD